MTQARRLQLLAFGDILLRTVALRVEGLLRVNAVV